MPFHKPDCAYTANSTSRWYMNTESLCNSHLCYHRRVSRERGLGPPPPKIDKPKKKKAFRIWAPPLTNSWTRACISVYNRGVRILFEAIVCINHSVANLAALGCVRF